MKMLKKSSKIWIQYIFRLHRKKRYTLYKLHTKNVLKLESDCLYSIACPPELLNRLSCKSQRVVLKIPGCTLIFSVYQVFSFPVDASSWDFCLLVFSERCSMFKLKVTWWYKYWTKMLEAEIDHYLILKIYKYLQLLMHKKLISSHY